MIKIVLGVMVAVLATVVAAKLAFEATAYTGAGPVNQPWAQNTMEFVAWNGEKWTAWVRDDTFEQRPQNESQWHEHANISLAFIGWEYDPWQAKIDGDGFLLAHQGNWKGSTKRASAIRYRDWKGENQLRTLAQLKR
ncbi:MAG: hypothetical protein O7C67_05920 [Gammaproteobacteria bacterium]|nr:hypothetical protein [Gammaproteobacteria bacterium]